LVEHSKPTYNVSCKIITRVLLAQRFAVTLVHRHEFNDQDDAQLDFAIHRCRRRISPNNPSLPGRSARECLRANLAAD
jgi:hypothetical protein